MSRFAIVAALVACLLIGHAIAASPFCATFKCDTPCLKCTSRVVTGDKQTVKIDFTKCKNGSSISWFCAKDDDNNPVITTNSCANSDGPQAVVWGPMHAPNNSAQTDEEWKCEKAVVGTYTLPATLTTFQIQVHDGAQSGDVNITAEENNLCGGGKGSCDESISGVCLYTINLADCQTGDPPEVADCTSTDISKCGAAEACETLSCVAGECTYTLVPASAAKVCRAAADGGCDVAESCSGEHKFCPGDGFQAASHVCRPTAGDCDVAENCPGDGPACPEDKFHGTETTCRGVQGDCDVAEVCTGTSANCPTDKFKPHGTICRDAVNSGGPITCDLVEVCTGGDAHCPPDLVKDAETECRPVYDVCDVAENCPGNGGKTCPTDAFKPSTAVCRAAKTAADGTTCDAVENCPGNAASCPIDLQLPKDTICRANKDLCDWPERCDGVAFDCPTFDLRKDHGYVYKCALTCYVCAVRPDELVLGNGAAYNLGGCGIGKCGNIVPLAWPQCVDQCVPANCPNNRGLSNTEVYSCVKATGTWSCDYKVEGTAVVNGHCPKWHNIV